MEMAISLAALIAMSAATYFGVRWMLKLGKSGTVKENPLSPADLTVLEETAARLMSDIRTVTDECVKRIDAACARARALEYTPAEPVLDNDPLATPATHEEAFVGSVSDLLAQFQPSKLELDYTTEHSVEPPVAAIEPSRPPAGVSSGEMELMKGLERLRSR
jgi:hypothetical protein